MEQAAPVRQQIDAQRASLLRRLEAKLEMPMALLGLVWLVLLVLEFTRGTGPVAARVGMAIWAAFLGDFLLKFILAPAKLHSAPCADAAPATCCC